MSNDWGDWRDKEFGEGQERYYQHLGLGSEQRAAGPQHSRHPNQQQPQPDPRSSPIERVSSGRSRKGILIAGAAVVAVAVAAGGAYAATRAGDAPDRTPVGGSTSATPTPLQPAPSARASAAASTSAARVPALTPGWQVNDGGDKDHAAYDIPPPSETFTNAKGHTAPVWALEKSPTMLAGYGNTKDSALGRRPSYLRDDFCKEPLSGSLAMLVWVNAWSQEPLDAASDLGSKWLKAVAAKMDGSSEKYGAPTTTTVRVNRGAAQAVQYRAKTPLTDASATKCGVKEAEVIVTAMPTGKGATATLVLVRKLGHPQSMTDAQATQIISTLRPA